MRRILLAAAVGAALGAGELALAQHHGYRGPETVRTLSERDIAEALDGRKARVTMQEVTFDAAWGQPRVLAAVRRVLGDDLRLLGLASRGLRPGHGQQALHVDWRTQETHGVWYACHAICALVDLTGENGATRALPGSHRNPWMLKNVRDPRKPHPAQRQLVGPAGTVFILNIHCVHSAMQNRSDAPRHALFAHFSRRDSPLLLADPPPAPGPGTLARFDETTRAILTSAPSNWGPEFVTLDVPSAFVDLGGKAPTLSLTGGSSCAAESPRLSSPLGLRNARSWSIASAVPPHPWGSPAVVRRS